MWSKKQSSLPPTRGYFETVGQSQTTGEPSNMPNVTAGFWKYSGSMWRCSSQRDIVSKGKKVQSPHRNYLFPGSNANGPHIAFFFKENT